MDLLQRQQRKVMCTMQLYNQLGFNWQTEQNRVNIDVIMRKMSSMDEKHHPVLLAVYMQKTAGRG